MLPWASAAHGRSEYTRLRNVVDALVRIAEHAGDTGPFLDEATATVMELTRATGAVVLTSGGPDGLQVRSARGQMRHIDRAAFDAGHTLAPACLRSHEALHSNDVQGDDRVSVRVRKGRALRSLICTPLRYGDGVLGVLEVCSSVVHAFDEIDAQAVALIGNALGGALGRQLELDEKARLLARLETALEATRAQARRYQDAALCDPLTGLPNRTHFLQRLHALCEHEQRAGTFAVLFLDLDGFKEINDRHGHATGDAVLREAAQDLRARMREGDFIGRLGGDEFVVLVAGLREGVRDVSIIAEHLQQALARPRPVENIEVGIKASIGWVVHEPGSSASTLLARADEAMYRQKNAKRGSS
ncbi:sensor domain-containing diguanylate cyclase [Lysobacter sp. A3-1-A15]|uniref:sensor domain-containing diguanylate cyclase n=1 Tax=Novilysobacter viscosus TaxID=3098602 RepID=UPI002ED9A797